MHEEITNQVAAAQRHIIERPRLTKLLDESTARVILLTAPAGYGKTTLARQWMADKPHVYYECGIESSDVPALALGLATAARTVFPRAETHIRQYLQLQTSSEARRLAAVVAHELAAWPSGHWLVIDDYHLVTDAEAAEDFVQAVAKRAGIRLFVASRVRPRWLTERMIMYGDVVELERGDLVMDQAEARSALNDIEEAAANSVLARAEGWPAAIGLAALARTQFDEEQLPTGLYAYLAEELYGRLAPSTKVALVALAQSPQITEDLVHAVSSRHRAILGDAVSAGFLTRPRGGVGYSMHPLLRDFLHSKHAELPGVSDAQRKAGKWLLAERRWDEAFAVIASARDDELLLDLIRASSVDLLRLGRGKTLLAWVAVARAAGRDDPSLAMTESELAFREGNYVLAAEFAEKAVAALDDSDAKASRAWRNLGHAMYFGEQPATAAEHYDRAIAAARTAEDRAEAVWGAFCCSAYVGDSKAHGFLDELEALDDPTPRFRVRLATGRVQTATTFGGAEEALAAALPVESLLDEIDDVMVRTSYLNIVATLLVANARYDDARPILDRAQKDAERAWLAFIPPLLDARMAMVEAGCGRFARASAILDRLDRAQGDSSDDAYLHLTSMRTRVRLLAVGRSAPRVDARAFPIEPDVPIVPAAAHSEYLAALALLAVAQGRIDDAVDLCERVDAIARTREPQIDAAFVRALIAEQEHDADRIEAAGAAFDQATSSGIWDGFVFAYRVSDALLRNIIDSGRSAAALTAIMSRARDAGLARRLRPDMAVRLKRPDGLTPREAEILHLLAQGLTNEEIAQMLFVSPVTVKVHLRHVFAKLGVRSRTEAALRAQAQGIV